MNRLWNTKNKFMKSNPSTEKGTSKRSGLTSSRKSVGEKCHEQWLPVRCYLSRHSFVRTHRRVHRRSHVPDPHDLFCPHACITKKVTRYPHSAGIIVHSLCYYVEQARYLKYTLVRVRVSLWCVSSLGQPMPADHDLIIPRIYY